jgi:predicted rRNA methylase YqxC with S4 and FtsJ domains
MGSTSGIVREISDNLEIELSPIFVKEIIVALLCFATSVICLTALVSPEYEIVKQISPLFRLVE